MQSLGCPPIAEPKPSQEDPVDDNNDDNDNNNNNNDNKDNKFEDIVEEHANGQTWILKSYRKTRGPNAGNAPPSRPVIPPSK